MARVVTERCAAPSRRLHRGEAAVEPRESLLLRIARGRHVGVGEACPFPGLSPDDVDAVEAAVPDHVEPLAALDGLDDALARVPEHLPSLAFALETALVDLWRAEAGIARSEVWGPPKEVATTGLVTLREALSEAPRLVDRGARTLKLKVAAHEAAAIADVVGALRVRLGEGVALRLDFNGALPIDEARRWLDAWVPLALELVEEPCTAPEELGRTAVPWALDESMIRPSVRARWTELGASAVVLKPTLLGGARACLRLATRAGEAGMGVVVTHAFEGEVAQRACAALAVAVPGVLPSGVPSGRGFVLRPGDV